MKYSDNQKLAFCQPRGQFPTAHAQIALCSSIRIIEDSDNRDSDNRGSTVVGFTDFIVAKKFANV